MAAGLASTPRATPSLLLLLIVLVAAGLAGCARPVVAPPPPDVRAIAILPVDNRTGSELYADAPPLLGFLRDAPAPPRVTATDVLTDELRRALAARGFAIVALAPPMDGSSAAVHSTAEAARRLVALGIEAHALYVRLWLWDASAPSHVIYVDVGLDAFLVAPDGRILWQARFPARPVDAGGASSMAFAYPEVARRVAATTIAELAPSAPPVAATTSRGAPNPIDATPVP